MISVKKKKCLSYNLIFYDEILIKLNHQAYKYKLNFWIPKALFIP